ncbi:MAG: inositol monophosphatase [Alphaproteobacteria bacterium]|nr:inositol monophosphatase [Alphaproteobacteria bacterium]
MIAALSPDLNIMVRAVRKAGARIVRDFGEVSSLQVSMKGPGDFVSNADTFAEKTLIEALRDDRPGYGILSEECGALPAAEGCAYRFIIDPIDGTMNFLHAVPSFALSVGLMKGDEIVAGVIYNPISNELYHAEKGRGAFVMLAGGNKRLRVSGRRQLSHCLIGTNGFSFPKTRQIMEKMTNEVASIRINGCSTLSLAFVAGGQFDAYVSARFQLWDVAVGYLLIREAGGYVSDLHGNTALADIQKSQTLIATNHVLQNSLKKLIGV